MKQRYLTLFLSMCSIFALAMPAWAEDDIAASAPPPAPAQEPAPTPAPARVVAPAHSQSVFNTPAAAGLSSEPAGITDHELVLRSFGFRVVRDGLASTLGSAITDAVTGTTTTGTGSTVTMPSMSMVGMRYWLNSKLGVDAGVGIYLHSPTTGDTQFGLGLAGGVPMAFSHYKHITFYFEPRMDVSFIRVAKDTTMWSIGLAGDIGAEATLGWLGIPRLSFTFAIGVGMRVQNNGNDNEFTFATRDFLDVLDANFGVIYYF